MTYKIIDNFLNESEFEIVSKNINNNKIFPWFFQPDVTDENENNNYFYFVHTFFEKDFNIESPFLYDLKPLLDKLSIKQLLRVKGNLYPNQGKFIEHQAHRDYDFKHRGAIFYLNTNDGYTKLDNNEKIKSIKNRLLLFDPSKNHSSTTCTNNKVRLNININFL